MSLEEEAAKANREANINMEYGSPSNRCHRKSRTFAEVRQKIVSKNEAVDSEVTTAPVYDPVATGEEECKVYTAKGTKHPTPAAPNQPAEEVTKELVAEDRAALTARNLSARQVRQASPVAAPPVHQDRRSARPSAPQVRKATPVAAPPVRRDAKTVRLIMSARPVRKAAPKAAPSVRRDTRSAGLSAPQVRKATPRAAPPVLRRRDTRNPSQSARPVHKGAPEAAPPVRREPSTFSRGVRRVEGEGRSALQMPQQSSVYLDRLEWGWTRGRSGGRSPRNFNKRSLPNAASADEATIAAESVNNVMMAANWTSGTPHGKVALGSDPMHTTVENLSKRRRLNIDLNREPESSSTAGAVAPSHESDATGGNDDPEVSSVETLLLLKSGCLK